jgi:hypothetical protein
MDFVISSAAGASVTAESRNLLLSLPQRTVECERAKLPANLQTAKEPVTPLSLK